MPLIIIQRKSGIFSIQFECLFLCMFELGLFSYMLLQQSSLVVYCFLPRLINTKKLEKNTKIMESFLYNKYLLELFLF